MIADVESWTAAQINNLQDAFSSLISTVESWTFAQLESARSAILAIIGNLETWTITEINTIRDTLTTLLDWSTLTNWITGWWNDRLFDIRGLLNSALIEWAPFWSGWQDWRDKVTEFFSDPEEWLYNAVDRIIERYW